MVMDLTEPIPAYAPPLSPSPERLLRLAIIVGIAGVIALLVAVIVLIWTVTGVSAPVVSQQAAIPADIESKPVPAAPAAALVPEPAPAPAPAPVAAPAAAPAAAGANSEILQNPAMAAIAPTAPAPVSDSAPTVALPTVTWPSGDVNGLDWNDLNSNLQNAAASYLWQNSGADATTGAIVGAGTAIGTTALNIVGNNAGNLVNTLILANLGYYGSPNATGNLVNTALAVPAAVSQIGVGVPSVPSLGVPSLGVPTSIGIPGTPIGTQIGPPQLPQIGPPQLPSLPGVGIGIPGTPIGIGF
ncbi:MAG: hypothetical protein QOI28_2849 [Mycobacterium sp.]|jgi:hypothetical protein|nr:hypothetical protein [Mycobacterium sp.]